MRWSTPAECWWRCWAAKSIPTTKRDSDAGPSRLLNDKVEQLIAQTRQECAGKAQAEAVEKELGYFVNNVERMQYGTFRRQGLLYRLRGH